MKLPTILSDGFLHALPGEERARLGRAGLTKEECARTYLSGEEKKLQRAVASWLTLHRIYHVRPRMDKKTTTPMGTPDFICCFPTGRFVAIETKTVKGTLSVAQTMRMAEVCWCGGTYLTIRSLEQLIEATKNL